MIRMMMMMFDDEHEVFNVLVRKKKLFEQLAADGNC